MTKYFDFIILSTYMADRRHRGTPKMTKQGNKNQYIKKINSLLQISQESETR